MPCAGETAAAFQVRMLPLLIPFAGGWVVTLSSMGGIVAMSLLCTLGGHALLTYLLGFVGADIVSFALLAEPIGAAIWAFVLFGETVSPSVLLGGLVIIAGLVLYTWKSMQKTSVAAHFPNRNPAAGLESK